jgi:phosphatidylglycerophosphate synthase
MSTARSVRVADTATKRGRARRVPAARFESPSDERLRVKARDACWTVFGIDPLAVPAASLAARHRLVTPNRLTLLSTLVAVGSATAFGFRQFLVGALVYQLAFAIDCMDGKVASIRGMQSRWGAFFDVAGDTGRFIVCFVALSLVAVPGQGGWALAAALIYACARFGLLTMAESRPGVADRGTVSVGPRPLAVLRAAPRRATKPGTTVDAELLALTIGPIVHEVAIGFAVAAALHLAHIAVLFLSSLRQAAAESKGGT